MCIRCARYVRNNPDTVTINPAAAHFYASRLLAGDSIPVFASHGDNLAVEAAVYHITRSRTDRSIYRRHGRRSIPARRHI